MTKPPFDRIVTRHGAVVLKVCRVLLRSPADAEDAWSETFLAALQAWPELPSDANVEAWLVRIAQRKAIDIGRRRKAIPVPEVPDRAQIDNVNGADVWSLVAELPLKQRQVIACHYLAGWPYAEIAQELGGSAAAARRAAADGMKTLRARKEELR